MGEEIGEASWTGKGVRQGSPLSPILFNILMADLAEELRKGRWGWARIRERSICSLAYADNVVVSAESEEDIESMMKRPEGYFEEKKLQVNVGKTVEVEGEKDRGGDGI